MKHPPSRRELCTFWKNVLMPSSPQLRWIHFVMLRARITSYLSCRNVQLSEMKLPWGWGKFDEGQRARLTHRREGKMQEESKTGQDWKIWCFSTSQQIITYTHKVDVMWKFVFIVATWGENVQGTSTWGKWHGERPSIRCQCRNKVPGWRLCQLHHSLHSTYLCSTFQAVFTRLPSISIPTILLGSNSFAMRTVTCPVLLPMSSTSLPLNISLENRLNRESSSKTPPLR